MADRSAAVRVATCTCLLMCMGACGESNPEAGKSALPSNAPSAHGWAGETKPVLGTFTGTFDAATGAFTLVYPGTAAAHPNGRIEGPQLLDVTLPYGGSASTGATSGDVLFHTCSASYMTSMAGGTLTATVQAVNNMTGPVQDLTVVIDFVSDIGTTFSTNLTSDNYGTVASGNDFSCSTATATWTFSQNSMTNFAFAGHATGTPPCVKVITSSLSESNPFSQSVSISYVMVGGGGAGSGSGGGGGGGGSSAILNGGSGTSLLQYAAGGDGAASGAVAGNAGTSQAGSFSLASSDELVVYVGGGGGGGSNVQGGGGGSGYYGGGGGNSGGGGGQAGGGGSNTGGSAHSPYASSGRSLAGGNGSSNDALGGSGATGGTPGSNGNQGGGGGGFGAGGGSADFNFSDRPTAGGSSGTSASADGSVAGGVGALTWASSTTLPANAGAGGGVGGQGGNGGLVILTYTSPTGTCSL